MEVLRINSNGRAKVVTRCGYGNEKEKKKNTDHFRPSTPPNEATQFISTVCVASTTRHTRTQSRGTVTHTHNQHALDPHAKILLCFPGMMTLVE